MIKFIERTLGNIPRPSTQRYVELRLQSEHGNNLGRRVFMPFDGDEVEIPMEKEPIPPYRTPHYNVFGYRLIEGAVENGRLVMLKAASPVVLVGDVVTINEAISRTAGNQDLQARLRELRRIKGSDYCEVVLRTSDDKKNKHAIRYDDEPVIPHGHKVKWASESLIPGG